MNISQLLTKLKTLVYSKSETDSLLGGKASSFHTHTKSQITDFPTIPTNTSQLTNDSGFLSTDTGIKVTRGANISTSGCGYWAAMCNSSQNSSSILPTADQWWHVLSMDWTGIGDDVINWCSQLALPTQENSCLYWRRNDSSDTSINSSTWHKVIDDTNIGSQSVNYANSAGSAGSSSSCTGNSATATTAGAVSTSVAEGSTKDLISATMAGWDSCWIRFGGASDAGYLEIATADNANEPIYVRQYYLEDGNARTLTLLDESGNTQFPGTVTAPTFTGNLNGNCSGTAGSVAWSNVSGKPSTFTPSSHTHTKSQITDFPTITVNSSNIIYFDWNSHYPHKAGIRVDKTWVGGILTTDNTTIPTKTSELTNDSGFLTSADRLPIGSYIQFAGSQAPAGFLVCNGGEINRTTYSQLFAVIGTTYGSGDGSTTFNLPNLTDRFLQGSTTSGTVKNAGLPNISGEAAPCLPSTGAVSNIVPLRGYWGAFRPEGSHMEEDTYRYVSQDGTTPKTYYGGIGIDAARSSSIYGNSKTVQPPALTCLICIKY